MANRIPIVILGAGPAGLGAAYRLALRRNFDVAVIERNPVVGGNAGSFELAGLSVDYGSHRLHPSCAPEIMSDIRAMLGDDVLDRPRHGRILIRGRWVHFPLKPVDLALHLPPSFLTGVAGDSVRKMVLGNHRGSNFEEVLESGLGRTICRDFYFPYARKIWGLAPAELEAEQARRRVSAGSIGKMIRKALNAVPGLKKPGAGRFYYPRQGFGQISQAYAKAAADAGAELHLKTEIAALRPNGDGALDIVVCNGSGQRTLHARQVLSTIPVGALVRLLDPQAPQPVLESAAALRFRSMILIYLVLETEQFTEFDAHYFPDAGIAITRLSEPKNYGLAALPGTTVLCAELPCFPSDPVWSASDEELGALVREALGSAGLPVRVPVRQVAARRLPQAYPLYTQDYRPHFERIDGWVRTVDGLVTFGRQGLFAHDNTHHALAMAYAAAACVGDDGAFDQRAWSVHREAFQHHVVED
jgi:protoporphyrinogen oxidase